LRTKDRINIDVLEIFKIDKLYDNIILPYLVKDSYHDELFLNDYWYNFKVLLYVALNKCKKKLVVLCPNSKREEIDNVISKLVKR